MLGVGAIDREAQRRPTFSAFQPGGDHVGKSAVLFIASPRSPSW
jgi:hypothetical protein